MWKIKRRKKKMKEQTMLQIMASNEIQNRYSQLDGETVDKLLIKFMRKEEIKMPELEYVIVSDVNDKIAYNEIHKGEVDRVEIAGYRARIEALKTQKTDIEKEIAELEELVAKGEHIIKLADEKKAKEEAMARAELELAQASIVNNEI
ncbi:MAG: hypothetical protein ACI4PF_01055 [Christensenellales bacterium]